MAESDDEKEEAPPEPAAASVGDLLRRLREARALTQEAVSLETRIPIASVRKIEENRFAELPGEVFVRGFLRAYARAVGADPARVMQVYEERHGPREEPNASRWPGLFRMPRRRRLGLFLALVLFLGILALLFAFVYRSSEEGVGRPPAAPGPAAARDAGDADASGAP